MGAQFMGLSIRLVTTERDGYFAIRPSVTLGYGRCPRQEFTNRLEMVLKTDLITPRNAFQFVPWLARGYHG